MDIVKIGDATLYHADCRDVLPTLGKFDLLLTDPPYGIGRDKGMGGAGTDATGRYKRAPRQYAGTWDADRPDPEVFAQMLNASTLQVIWGGNYFTDVLPVGARWLFWDKLNAMPSFSDGEMAWTSLPGVTVKKFMQCASGLAANVDGRVHPTQKPLALTAWCLTHVPYAKSVLDPFMGSGTTGVACAQSGRAFTGIERERKYFDIACERIERAYAQGKLFAPETVKPEQGSILEAA